MRLAARCGLKVVFCTTLLATVPSLLPAQSRQPEVAPPLRIKLVGQALIRHDLRTVAPLSVEQARAYMADADVRFTNLETTVGDAGTAADPDAPLHSPASVLDALGEMGFNLLSMANNHAFELGEAGIFSGIAAVERRGFAHAGTGADGASAAAAGYLDTPRGKVALIAMASGGVQLTPETRAGPGKPGVNFLELQSDGTLDPVAKTRILAAVREAAKSGAFVIAYQHNHYWGEARGPEGPPERERRVDRFDTPDWMEAWARELVDAGASIYVSHGDPSLHGVEIYEGRLILYGLGNYIFNSANTPDRYGPLAFYSAVAEGEFVDGRVTALRFRPLVLAIAGEASGAPYLAQGGEAAAVLGRLAEISRRYGTVIRIEGDVAEVVLPGGAGPRTPS